MSTNDFQFKQFRIKQQNAAMKVSTDACIFGAWVAALWKEAAGLTLDIGTGTGLLSLMLLQENKAIQVTALEPETSAAKEAAHNFKSSAWNNRISVYPEKLQDFYQKSTSERFNLIICNPPFFQNHLLGEDENRNQARHNTLTPEELAFYCKKIITEQGQLAVIYPADYWRKWLQAAGSEGWKAKYLLKIKPSAQKPENRICGIFDCSSDSVECTVQTLTIRDEQSDYTNGFTALLKDFYLHL